MQRPSDTLMVVTAAYTDLRWRELAALDRVNVDLDTGVRAVQRGSRRPCVPHLLSMRFAAVVAGSPFGESTNDLLGESTHDRGVRLKAAHFS